MAVVSFLLPAQPPSSCNRKNVLVSLQWVVSGLGTEYRCCMRRDNHANIFAVTRDYVVGRHPVICADGGHADDRRLDLIQQRRHLRRVSNIVPGQGRSHDHSGVGIHSKV